MLLLLLGIGLRAVVVLLVIILGDVIGLVDAEKLHHQPVECVARLSLSIDGQKEGDKEGGRTEEHELFIAGQSARRGGHVMLARGTGER